MVMNSQFHKTHQSKFQNLIDGLSPEGRYAYLQLFLSRKADKLRLPSYYLWVSRDAFGKVRLDAIDFDGTNIQLDIQDCSTGLKSIIQIDINDGDFKLLLISWEDIRNLVLGENKSVINTDELLEFEF